MGVKDVYTVQRVPVVQSRQSSLISFKMRFRPAHLLLCAAALLSAPARAQSVHFKFTDAGAGYNAFGVYIGTYGGVQAFGAPSARYVGLNCVDYFHEVGFGQEWDANISYLGLGDISNARHPLDLEKYKQAAWLISQYSAANVQAVQGTLWNLFASPGVNWPSDPTLLAESAQDHPGFDFSKFYVVTDVNANGPMDANSVQEFLVYDANLDIPARVTSTPEPASLVLLGSGLLGVGVVVRRKRQRGSNSVAA